MSKKEGVIAPIVVLVGICLVVSAALAGAYQITSPIIEQRAREAADLAKAMVLPDGDSFAEYEGTLVENVTEVYTADNGSGIVCKTNAKGFGGPVELMIGINSNKEVTGIQVMSHGETPGVGTNALTEEYFAKFNGQTSGDNVDAYSGASLTSRAVKGGVNAAIMQLDVVNGADYEAPVELTEDELIDQAASALLGTYEELSGVTLEENVLKVLKGADDKGYAMLVQGVGHYPEDPFKLLVGVDSTGAVSDISVIYQNETPGFGCEVLDECVYFEQFIGATQLTRKSGGEGTKIDVVSEATETSVGAYDAVKAALNQFAALQ